MVQGIFDATMCTVPRSNGCVHMTCFTEETYQSEQYFYVHHCLAFKRFLPLHTQCYIIFLCTQWILSSVYSRNSFAVCNGCFALYAMEFFLCVHLKYFPLNTMESFTHIKRLQVHSCVHYNYKQCCM